MLLAITPITASASSPSIRGYSTSAQTVYTGPSSSYYVSVGSIGNGERVYILGKEQGWYHIVYDVNSGGQKSGYVPMNSIRDISGGTPVEDDFWGGYAMSNSTQTVYSCDDYSTKISIGSISSQEGVTRLYGYNSTASNGQTYSVLFIEYSTSSGAKRGYVFNPNFSYPYSKTCVGRMTMGVNLSYGVSGCNSFSNTTFGKAGYVGEGEYVSVIAKIMNRMMLFILNIIHQLVVKEDTLKQNMLSYTTLQVVLLTYIFIKPELSIIQVIIQKYMQVQVAHIHL